MANIFDVVGNGAVVYADEDRGVMVTYAGGSTFNIWTTDGRGNFYNNDMWMSGHTQPRDVSWRALKELCEEHFTELDEEEDEDDEERYEVGDRVQTPDGPGTIIALDDTPPEYYVDLDHLTGECSAEYYYGRELEPLDDEDDSCSGCGAPRDTNCDCRYNCDGSDDCICLSCKRERGELG